MVEERKREDVGVKGGDHMQVEEGKAKLAKTTLETTLTYFRG